MTPLRLLLIEDSTEDAELVVHALTQAGYDVHATRVDTAAALCEAFDAQRWDIAIADFTMPSFSGTRALALIRERDRDLPFIFVSGTIGEDTAVAAMRTGARDYIMKGHMARLAPAVERELREAAIRREHTRAHERATFLAYHDPLTALPNRALLQDRLHQAMLTAGREKKSVTLLVLDLDGFKEINDALGHHVGDRVLEQVAERLRVTLRASDTVARLGGDEFAILLPFTDLLGAEAAAQKILEDFEQPCLVDGRALVVYASVGIAGFPAHASHGDELLQKADQAMYVAKADHSGYAIYTANQDRNAEHRLALMTAMREGIQARQFVLEYQPIVDLATDTVVAVEGLLRWDHPVRGRLWPKDFIPIAEHTGLIKPLTDMAIERALADWPPGMLRSIAVNLSPRSLLDGSFPARLRHLLAGCSDRPSGLALEITENVIMTDPDRSIRCLSELREMGIRIVLDDFGTGYSSLSYLRRLPVDQLKIDKSFVIGMANGEDEALVTSIINLAHSMKLSVVAEGVENDVVLDRLRALGCDAVQGNGVRPPGPPEAIAQWIHARERLSI